MTQTHDPISAHDHECRSCGGSISCPQTEAECDANGGIGQYNGQCDDCNVAEAKGLGVGMSTAAAPITLAQAVERLLDSARSGLCRHFDGPSIADGDPFTIQDTGTEAGDVRVFCDADDSVSIDVPSTNADGFTNIVLGRARPRVPTLFDRLTASLDTEVSA